MLFFGEKKMMKLSKVVITLALIRFVLCCCFVSSFSFCTLYFFNKDRFILSLLFFCFCVISVRALITKIKELIMCIKGVIKLEQSLQLENEWMDE
jgi:hypothetical protein